MNLNLIFKEQTLKFNKEEQETYLFLQQHIAIGLIFLKR